MFELEFEEMRRLPEAGRQEGGGGTKEKRTRSAAIRKSTQKTTRSYSDILTHTNPRRIDTSSRERWPPVEREDEGRKSVLNATTQPLPKYLLASNPYCYSPELVVGSELGQSRSLAG